MPTLARSFAPPCSASTSGPRAIAGPIVAGSRRSAADPSVCSISFPASGAVLRENRQRLAREPGLFERIESLLRPRDVLEHGNGEESSLSLDHGHVM